MDKPVWNSRVRVAVTIHFLDSPPGKYDITGTAGGSGCDIFELVEQAKLNAFRIFINDLGWAVEQSAIHE